MSSYRPTIVPHDFALVLAALPRHDSESLQQAFQFAAAAHDGQTRDEGTPFIDHPVRVATILWLELACRDVDLIAAALAHDILEDCPEIAPDALAGVIGAASMRYVQDVTKPPAPDGDKEARDQAYLERLPALPYESRLLKLADRIDNVRSALSSPEDGKAARYLCITREYFFPLAIATNITAERLLTEALDALEGSLSGTLR